MLEVIVFFIAIQLSLTMETSTFNPLLLSYLKSAESQIAAIPADRIEKLNKLVSYIQLNKDKNEPSKLIFICTHNSRRSHLCQIWAKVAAEYFGLGNFVDEYSGGTEATAFNPRAIAAIVRTGLKAINLGGENPRIEIIYKEDKNPIICFSKRYNATYNPQEKFAAIMTCSDADQNCPVVLGAEKRISLPYIDPKISDGTPEESKVYDERCLQIAIEQLYVFSKIK